MVRVLVGFQDQVVQHLTGQLPQQRLDGRWKYVSVEAAREETGFDPMETYIWVRQNAVEQYIATQPILDL